MNATYHFVFVSPGRAKLEALGRLVDLGRLRPVIGAVLPLDGIPQAHTLLEGGTTADGRTRPRGKIAIAVHPEGGRRRGQMPRAGTRSGTVHAHQPHRPGPGAGAPAASA